MKLRVWCKTNDKGLGSWRKEDKLIRCKDCKKRFKVFWRPCNEFEPNCLHPYMPKHKMTIKI